MVEENLQSLEPSGRGACRLTWRSGHCSIGDQYLKLLQHLLFAGTYLSIAFKWLIV